MPLFMMISGYLFYNSNKKNFKTLIVLKLKAIGIPMLSFVLLYCSYHCLTLLRHGHILEMCKFCLATIFLSTPMWYLLSLLLNIAIFAILTRLVRNTTFQYAGMISLFIISLFIPDSIVLGVHKFMFPFFCVGYIIKQHDVNIYACSYNKQRLSILTILSVLAIMWFDKNTYIYVSGFCINGDINQLLIDIKRMVIAFIVSYTFMQYARMLVTYDNRIIKHILKFGQISLFIYGFNVVFNALYTKALSFMSLNFEFNYVIPIIISSCFLFISLLLYEYLEKNKFTRMAFLGK